MKICMLSIFLITLFVIFTPPLFPQEQPTVVTPTERADSGWYYGKVISRISFENLQLVRESDLRGITDQYIGSRFDDSLLQDLQQRLFALDFFSDIVARAERVVFGSNAANEMELVFFVTENPLVANVRFEGNAALGSGLLRETVLVKERDVIIDSELRVDVARIEQLYRERGFPDATVTYRTSPVNQENSARQTVYFTIVEGRQEVVRSIIFRNNTVVSDNVLIGIMNTKPQSLFNRGALNAAALKRDEQLIVEYYQSQGYIDAQVLDVTQRLAEDEREDRIFYIVEIVIEEGNRYTLGSISFRGNVIYSDDELREQLRMRSGDILDLNRFNADFQRVVNLYFDNGYIFNTIDQSELRDNDTNEVSFVINIVERPRAHIENIIIRGNTKTKDKVILRELPFAVGEVFSASRIRRGILNLYNLQYFGNVLPETPPGSVEGLMDLILNIEEGQTADIRFGLAFGGFAEFPISLQLGWQDRNFLGNGHAFAADINLSFATQEISVSFTEPWLADLPFSLRADVDFRRTSVSNIPQDIIAPIFGDNDPNAVPDPYTGEYVFSRSVVYNSNTYDRGEYFPGTPTETEIRDLSLQTDYEFAGGESRASIPDEYLLDYILWAVQLGVGVGYRIPTPIGLVRVGTTISSSIQIVEYDAGVFRPYDPLLRAGLNQPTFLNRWIFRVALDDRDLFYNPSSGYYLAQVLTLNGGILFGDRHYIRSDTRGEIHFTLADVPVSDDWDFKLVLGLQTLFSAIFPQFFVPEEFRDRSQPVATQQDLLYIDGVFFGRGWPRVFNGEALWDSIVEIRMPLSERIIWLDLFFEMASLWTDINTVAEVDFLENTRFTFGGGVRFTIPQFPIRLYFAKRFQVINGNIDWQTSPLFNFENTPGGGIDFVFSIGADLF